jgi:hypothetical protein
LRPERREHRRSARQAAVRRVVPAVWSVWWSGRPHSEASSVRRDAAAPSLRLHQVAGRPSAVLSAPAWSQVPAVAWRQPVGAASAQAMASPSEMKAAAVAESASQVASAL